MYIRLEINNQFILNKDDVLYHWDNILDDLLIKAKDKNFEHLMIPFQVILLNTEPGPSTSDGLSQEDFMIVEAFLRKYKVEYKKVSSSKLFE